MLSSRVSPWESGCLSVIYLFFILERLLLCSHRWLGTCYLEHVGLELVESCFSLQSVRITGFCHYTWLCTMVGLLKKLLSESWLAPAPWLLSLDMYIRIQCSACVGLGAENPNTASMYICVVCTWCKGKEPEAFTATHLKIKDFRGERTSESEASMGQVTRCRSTKAMEQGCSFLVCFILGVSILCQDG